ncbi:DNA polymerase III subunit gamma and tau [Cellulomonas sp. NTE-D12]|uniref:DNA polymerase III subunit gamma and tau n=1 Tax=Cellulomonas sp. NTE-D12 TaxID=2962632 RepID=UPI0030814C5B|nr:hypothetical protein CELD12_03400 [Cellulomonas sp. NTE-D12]
MTTALYRRYRPETFAEVIGQDHVTAPLRQALRSGQVNHAYLFSGPRGCGKTSSARILARVLNCAQNTAEHPTDTPCGECESCIELATGGPGSLDVVEIDAASHGGVDDARELRERATFAPARDRYKVFILDEAHMVSNQGFNALLKIVEEPPPHVKFIFATTEPDKVIGTIRSRTHHYPFRLVPPDVLVPYLAQLCEQEGVPVGSGVLPLVVRAGAGSVRDSLSVLDQLIAGAGESGLEYESAVALLGYTPASLLDDLVEAIAARDGATAFSVVERVVATGHEPRRFVEDLLERLRDLIVLAAAGDAAGAALGMIPSDQLDRMRAQAAHLGAAELSRSADLANAALTEMAGATSPRLHLELLMARLLLPAADDGTLGLGARLDRLERGGFAAVPAAVGAGGAPTAATRASAPVEPATPPLATPPVATPSTAAPSTAAPSFTAPSTAAPVSAVRMSAAPPAAAVRAAEAPAAAADVEAAADAAVDLDTPPWPVDDAPARSSSGRKTATAGPSSAPAAAAAPAPAATAPPAPAVSAPPAAPRGAGGPDTEMLRRRWPEVLGTLRGLRLLTHALVSQHAQVLELDATTLRLGFAQPGLIQQFQRGSHAEAVAQALRETLGVEARVEGVLGDSATPAGSGAPADRSTAAATPASAADLTARSSSGGATDRAATRSPGIPSVDEAAASWGRPVPSGSAAAPAAAPAPKTGSAGGGSAPRASRGRPGAPATAPAASSDPGSDRAPAPQGRAAGTAAPARRSGAADEPPDLDPPDVPVDDLPPGDWIPPDDEVPFEDPRDVPRDPVAGSGPRAAAPGWSDEPDEPSPDDPLIDGSGLVGAPLVARLLGGTVIDEQIDDPNA